MINRYFIIKHYFTPFAGEKTESKDFWKKGKKDVHENINFRSRISPRDLVEATTIIDLKENKIIKNRYRDHKDTQVKDENLIEHYLKEYKDQIAKVS